MALLLAGLAVLAFATVWFAPSVQDRIVKRGMVAALSKANALPFMQDKGLHLLLCGTGSPVFKLTRASSFASISMRAIQMTATRFRYSVAA